jgi:hypothetical protein
MWMGILKCHLKPDIRTKLFLDYLTTMFPSFLEEFRRNEEFVNRTASPFMENCSFCVSEAVFALLTENRDNATKFASRASHMFQMLNESLSGPFERRKQYQLPMNIRNMLSIAFRQSFTN